MKLLPCTFCWKTDETKKHNNGFTADEVKQIYPELVADTGIKVGEDENIESVNYVGMIPMLVGSLQHLIAEVKALKAEVELLKNPII